MTWYALRTAPGAQMPQRSYEVETTRSHKGYRIVPSLDPNVSAVERVLSDNGIRHYMPCEYKVIRDRRKTDRWTRRRFAILPGYVFVADVLDWPLVESLPGVIGAIGNANGEKYQLSVADFIFLRTREARSEAEADDTIAARHRHAQGAKHAANAKKLARVKKRFPQGSRVDVQWGRAIGRKATIVGWDDDAQLQAIVEGLEGTVTLSTNDVKMVA